MEVLHARCAGYDVHSRCVNDMRDASAAGLKVTTEHREFAKMFRGVLLRAGGLADRGQTSRTWRWRRPACTGSRCATSSKTKRR